MGGGQSKLLATLDGFKYLETLKVSKSSTKNKKGFTLAEVLITLGIIGVVAAVTMPMLITNVRNHVRAKRIENIEQKFSKATDKMVALGVYNGHGSTAEFVNELGKHLKLAKVCDNSNLASCWPTEKVITRKDGTTWDIKNTKTGESLGMENDDTQTWSNTMGIITADGTSMILSYNTKCGIDDTRPITYSGSVSSTTGCVALVYDWNGATKPNKYSDDVLPLNAGKFANSCLFEVGSTCYTKLVKAVEPVTYTECESMKSTHGIQDCEYDDDYWAGAIKQCGHVNSLPTLAQLGKLAEEMYLTSSGAKPTIGGWDGLSSLAFQSDSSIVKSLGLTPPFFLWSKDIDDSTDSYTREFFSNETSWGSYSRDYSRAQVLCIGD